MFNFSFWDVILILMVALIVFGPGKLPEVARSLGKGIVEFRKMTNKASKVMDITKSEVDEIQKDAVSPIQTKKEEGIKNTVGNSANDKTMKADSKQNLLK